MRKIRWSRFAGTALSGAAMIALLSAFTAGPDFRRPAPVTSQHYDQAAEQATAARLGGAIEGDWWSSFGSAKLDRVMRQAIDGNLDLAAADATIAQANEGIVAARGRLLPQADLGAEASRQRAGGTNTDFYAVGPGVSFDFDLFGSTKRLVEQRAALADLEKHRFDAAYLTLTGDVASQALLLASARAQIEAVEKLLADDRRNLALVRVRHQYGSATQVDIALATTQLAQDETLLPPLAQQRDTALHALSVLAGKGPADWVAPNFDLADFALPADMPVSLPADLARNRPDILAAEAQLHAASAAIGIAAADLYPRLQLSASLSAVGPGIGSLWSIAAGLTGPLFHGGTLKANKRASADGYKASLAGYQQTVLRSLGQVADVLQTINHDGEEYAAQQRALSAAEASLRLNRLGYQAGEIDTLQVLDTERAYQRALLGHIRARTAQHLDMVQLSVALGGNVSGAFARRMASRDDMGERR